MSLKNKSKITPSVKHTKGVNRPLDVFPLLPLRDIVVFPYMIAPLLVGRQVSINAVNRAWANKSRTIVLVTQKNPSIEIITPQNLYKVGILGKIIQAVKMDEGYLKVLIEGLKRVKIKSFSPFSDKEKAGTSMTVEVSYEDEDTFYQEEVASVAFDNSSLHIAKEAMLISQIKNEFKQYAKLNTKTFSSRAPLSGQGGNDYINSVQQISQAGKLADIVSSYLPLKTQAKQQLLEIFSPHIRLTKVSELLKTEIEVIKVEEKIHGKVKEKIRKTQKEFYLQEQMKAIQKELGGEEDPDISSLKEKIRKSGMPKEVEKRASAEVAKLSKMMSISPEATVIRNYVEWLINMPWSKETKDKLDIKWSEKILNEDHYGLEKVKERILEYLAVRKLVGNPKGPILCFAGPPGVGKTSIAKSIARALGRKFIRISLGGVRDEAEIRGHRRTYIGALPGKIIQSMHKAGSKNPIFLLDEIDKMSMDFRGDPSAALLEVLDPEQNTQFNDHYLDVDFDLSKVMFITTANTPYAIPHSLLDRMEIIEFDGYSEEEKKQIALKFLISKLQKSHGFKKGEISISNEALHKIIRYYTREAGVRSLERELSAVFRKMARRKVEKKYSNTKKKNGKIKFLVTEKMVEELLLPPRYHHLIAEEKDEVGISIGLAVSETGGEILLVEATVMEGKGKLVLTGQLGEVMQESAQAALSYIRSHHKEKLKLKKDFYKDIDIHIHVPEGAIPKDGPSAGVAMTVAMASALAKKPVRKKIAMTGEITLRGKVLPVGGIKGKVLAAYRDGIKTIILPKENEKDLIGIPAYVKKNIKFLLVEEIGQVFEKIFTP
ncbi:MAG: endopeptidase La [Candidatus Omnitrophota bacterium]